VSIFSSFFDIGIGELSGVDRRGNEAKRNTY